MIRVGKWFLGDAKMLFLILQPFHGELPQKKLFPSYLRLTIDQLLPVWRILVCWEGKSMEPIMNSSV
jgi:hypothetical protein